MNSDNDDNLPSYEVANDEDCALDEELARRRHGGC